MLCSHQSVAVCVLIKRRSAYNLLTTTTKSTSRPFLPRPKSRFLHDWSITFHEPSWASHETGELATSILISHCFDPTMSRIVQLSELMSILRCEGRLQHQLTTSYQMRCQEAACTNTPRIGHSHSGVTAQVVYFRVEWVPRCLWSARIYLHKHCVFHQYFIQIYTVCWLC